MFVFKGSYFDYLIFIVVFDVMIEKKVDLEKDKLYFLSKYIFGKVYEVVKGFLIWDFDKGYEEVCKFLV